VRLQSAPIPRPLPLLLSATPGLLVALDLPTIRTISRQAAPILFFFDQLIGMSHFFLAQFYLFYLHKRNVQIFIGTMRVLPFSFAEVLFSPIVLQPFVLIFITVLVSSSKKLSQCAFQYFCLRVPGEKRNQGTLCGLQLFNRRLTAFMC
jgi:hypothetical protein